MHAVSSADAPNVNTISFPTSDAGKFTQVIADFDFRITPGNAVPGTGTPLIGRADGFSFALLNTDNFNAGSVPP